MHSAYRGADGSEIQTSRDDRLVILFSHNGSGTLDNSRGITRGRAASRAERRRSSPCCAGPRRGPVAGPRHAPNAYPLHHDPADPARGFWEITTCAVADSPCQTRVVELVDHVEYLSIVATMVDHDTPLGPASLEPR